MATLKNRYFILRHGQSLANVQGIISSDPAISTLQHGLSETGFEEASGAAQRLSELLGPLPVLIISSDFRRTRDTAETVRSKLRVKEPVEYDIRLRERYFGQFNGLSNENYDLVWAQDQHSMTHTFKDSESVYSVVQRTTALILDLEKRYTNQCIVLVSHGDTLQILQTVFERVPHHHHRSLPHLKTCEVRELVLKELPKSDL
eukprot:TRINITY_DN6093_c0_g1_i2.p1 TRINITY_DN6093_c0_g1~~TRINITY_DN6093_c0_g1_i2.p1  ORF type:complete len:203 (+),score=15.32 TRINITY_DN6093_c0_g1_i2:142-750(+)